MAALPAFGHYLRSGTYLAAVQKDLEEGTRGGVTGTPAFFINGQILSGAQPIDRFVQIIDATGSWRGDTKSPPYVRDERIRKRDVGVAGGLPPAGPGRGQSSCPPPGPGTDVLGRTGGALVLAAMWRPTLGNDEGRCLAGKPLRQD